MPRATSRWRPASRPWRAAMRRACSAICRDCWSAPGPGVEGGGSITGVFSVLVDGDDHNDPVADNIRGTLDGHIVLDRAIADQGRYPAVNILSSISRLAAAALDAGAARAGRRGCGRWSPAIEETRELRLMGGYTPGGDPVLDQAVKTVPRIYEAMTQSLSSPCESILSSIWPRRSAPDPKPGKAQCAADVKQEARPS